MALLPESMIETVEPDPINDQFKHFLATFTSTHPSAKATDSPAFTKKYVQTHTSFGLG